MLAVNALKSGFGGIFLKEGDGLQFSQIDESYMRRALSLAEKGQGHVAPNPMVGAVLVKEGRVIGEGYHQVYGQAHAEVNAFRNATEDPQGATLYVTLEPCSHYGKTPPCADLIVEKKVSKVVIAMLDPNPLVAGRGVKKLEDAGIAVYSGLLEEESRKLNEVFIKFITTKRPFVFFKCAMTLDGKIATVSGQSRWISSEQSRAQVHGMRGYYRGIMAGIGTVLADNPLLTCRTGGANPTRIIVDSRLRIPEDALVLNDDAPTLIACTHDADEKKARRLTKGTVEVLSLPAAGGQVDPAALLEVLGSRNIDGILLEGGGTLAYSFLSAGLVDKVRFYIAPKLFGGAAAKTPVGGSGISDISDAIELTDMTVTRCGRDIVVEGYPQRR